MFWSELEQSHAEMLSKRRRRWTVRPIDADVLLEKLQRMIDYCEKDNQANGLTALFQVGDAIMDCPTLTPPNEWVSVEDRMPEDDAPAGRKQITVMVATKAGKVTIASRVFEPERDYCGKVYPARWLWSRWLNNHVTHWMPLPTPPDSRPPEVRT